MLAQYVLRVTDMARVLAVGLLGEGPSADLGRALDSALSGEGHQVTLVDSLAAVQSLGWAPDLVILDVAPGEDGPNLCASVLWAWPDAALLALAGDPSRCADCLVAGADACLGKPFDPDQVVAEVRRLLP
jgi:DNA-binding response OmpR family regulator